MSIHVIGKAVDKFAPLRKAKTSWDNVGVLVDCGSEDARVLLTIDLTEPVLNECIEMGIRNILAYHPVIFAPLKKLDLKEKIVVECIKNNINVFCPHSALDRMMNEYVYRMMNDGAFYHKKNYGPNTSTIESAIRVLKEKSGLQCLRVCMARAHTMSTVPETMYVGVGATFRHTIIKRSIVITGEMSHHDLLACIANETSVILMEHSNSERICLEYIGTKLKSELPEYEVYISKRDVDPVTIV
jgi:putative NIF3 family GTP cyclohydrolase 1 type 2